MRTNSLLSLRLYLFFLLRLFAFTPAHCRLARASLPLAAPSLLSLQIIVLAYLK
jgi:hypothetical protein